MNLVNAVTEKHIATYRTIRTFIYHNRRAPHVDEIRSMTSINNTEGILEILSDLKRMGYVTFDNPSTGEITLIN